MLDLDTSPRKYFMKHLGHYKKSFPELYKRENYQSTELIKSGTFLRVFHGVKLQWKYKSTLPL
jgi:hypothetical protein